MGARSSTVAVGEAAHEKYSTKSSVGTGELSEKKKNPPLKTRKSTNDLDSIGSSWDVPPQPKSSLHRYPAFVSQVDNDKSIVTSCYKPSGGIEYVSDSVFGLLGFEPEDITSNPYSGCQFSICPHQGAMYYRKHKDGSMAKFHCLLWSKSETGEIFTMEQVVPHSYSDGDSVFVTLDHNGRVTACTGSGELRKIINIGSIFVALCSPSHTSYISDAIVRVSAGKSLLNLFTEIGDSGRASPVKVTIDFLPCVDNNIVACISPRRAQYASDVESSEENVYDTDLRIRELRAEVEYLTDFRENIALAMFSVDGIGCIKWANEAMSVLLGYNSDGSTLVGKTCFDIVADHGVLPEMMERVRSPGGLRDFSCQIRRRTGEILNAIYNSSGRFDNKGNLLYTRCIVQDVTEAANLQHERVELEKREQAAIAASKTKTDFLAVMSHELRTPINGVLGAASLLETTPIDDEQSEYLKTIVDSADMLLSLIHNILDITKIEKGQFDMESVSFRLGDLVQRSCGVMQTRATEKDVNFVTSIEPPLNGRGCWHLGDPSRLNQVLLNFLSNAVKFTHAGKVECRVRIEDSNEGVDNLCIEVSDTGIGIDDCSKLFSDFVQASPQTFREYGGTGLGLSISRKLVEMMGGSVGMSSVVGTGTTVWARFPLQRDFSSRKRTGGGRMTNMLSVSADYTARILVAEDNKVNSKLITRMLHKLGYADVTVAADGKEAVDAVTNGWVTNNRFDIVLMDCLMPVMSGWEATVQIREYESKVMAGVPNDSVLKTVILALTANATEEDQTKCFDCGMDDFFVKPITKEKVATLLLDWTTKAHDAHPSENGEDVE